MKNNLKKEGDIGEGSKLLKISNCFSRLLPMFYMSVERGT